MADNVTADPGTGGASFVTAELSWSGDTVHVPGSFLGLLTGSEGAWTYSSLLGGAGTVAAGVLRATLANDDPAVVKLGTIDTDTGNIATATAAIQAAVEGTLTVNGSGVTQPVSGTVTVNGTVTANLSTTDNDVLDAIAANTASGAVVGGGVEATALRVTIANNSTGVVSVDDNGGALTVDGTVAATQSGTWNVTNISGTVSLPTGAATAANQTTIIGHVDGIETVLGTIDADTGNIVTSVQLLDNVIGTEDSAVPANVALVGGRYDSSARTLETGDIGAVALNASGHMLVEISAGAGSGGTAAADDADFVAGTTSGTPAMGVYESTPTNVTDGDLGTVGITQKRAQKATLYKADGTEVTYIDANIGDVAGATEAGVPTLAIRDDALSTLADAEGDWVGLRVSSTGALHVTGGGGGTEYAVDAALGATPTGSLAIAIRDDALSTLTPVEGDAIGLRVDANGALWVIPSGTLTVASHAVTNAGTFAVQAAQSGTWNITNVSGTVSLPTGASTLAEQQTQTTALQLIDDTVATLGTTTYAEATTKGLIIGAVRRDADTTLAGTTNEVAPLQVDANGYLKVEIFDGGGSHTVDGTVAATQSGAWNVTDISGTVSLPTGAATSANQSTEITALQLLDNTIVAHDGLVSGSTGVSIIGFEARSTEPTAVASADATRAMATLLGKQVVLPFAIPASSWSYASPAAVADTADDVAIAAGTGAERRYITGVQVFNGHDTVGTEVVIKDGATVMWRGWAEQTGGGCSAAFNPPLRGTAATAVNVANITTGSATYFNLQGYTAAE